MATLQSSELYADMAALHTQGTPPQDPEQELNFPGLVQAVNPRGRLPPPDLQDVLTQQTAILRELAREVRDNRQQAPQQRADPDFVPADPNFDWNLMALPAETNFQLPCEGKVQEIAAGLLARILFMQGRDLHDAKFVLRVVSMWPDLTDQDRKDILFQRLNVYAIVASVGWPTAIAACSANSRSSAFYLPQGVQVVQQGNRQQQQQQQPNNNRQRRNNQRQQPQQQQRNAPAPAPAPQRNRRR